MVVNKPIKELAYWQQYAAWRWRAVAKVRGKNCGMSMWGKKDETEKGEISRAHNQVNEKRKDQRGRYAFVTLQMLLETAYKS